jgi:hypothetical protein
VKSRSGKLFHSDPSLHQNLAIRPNISLHVAKISVSVGFSYNLDLYEFKLKAVLRAVRYANWLLWQVDGLSLFKIPVLEGVVLRPLLSAWQRNCLSKL